MIQTAQACCPRCHQALRFRRAAPGFAYVCELCGGQAVSSAIVRRVIGRAAYRDFLDRTRQPVDRSDADCPFCRRRMTPLDYPAGTALDVCNACGFLWLDPGEREALPAAARDDQDEARPRTPQLERALEFLQVPRFKRGRRKEELEFELRDDLWRLIPLAMVRPVRLGPRAIGDRPWITWGLTALCALAFALTWNDRASAIAALGLVPAQPWRDAGITWLTSAFLHTGLLHVLVNVYVLLFAGTMLEECLGPARYLLLCAGAQLGAGAGHVLLDPRSELPLVGASGAISGVLLYFILQFPRQRIAVRERIRFLSIPGPTWGFISRPAWFYVLFWWAEQAGAAMLQRPDFLSVSISAHVGGAVSGLLLWLAWRPRRRADALDAPVV